MAPRRIGHGVFCSLAVSMLRARVALFLGTFYFWRSSNLSLHLSRLATIQFSFSQASEPSLFLWTRPLSSPPQSRDWIPSTQQTGNFLLVPDHGLALSGWEPGQKIKCGGFISTNLRGMYSWTSRFLFIAWNSWSLSNRVRSAVTGAKVPTSIPRVHNSIPTGSDVCSDEGSLLHHWQSDSESLVTHSCSVSWFHQP